jgi:hypothetical protein
VALPGAYVHAGIALRVIGANKPGLHDNYWEVMMKKETELEMNFLEKKLKFKICNRMWRSAITIVRPCRHNGYSNDTRSLQFPVLGRKRPVRRRRLVMHWKTSIRAETGKKWKSKYCGETQETGGGGSSIHRLA